MADRRDGPARADEVTDEGHRGLVEPQLVGVDGPAGQHQSIEVVDVTAPGLVDAINHGLATAPSALIVDLCELDFRASAGMTVLLHGHRAAGTSTRFGVVADGPHTSRPMRLMGLDQDLHLYPTLNEAFTDAV